MVKTQIQLTEYQYAQAKRIAREREMSLAEVIRRGVEYMAGVYPPLGENARGPWELPGPLHMGLRKKVDLEGLKDVFADDEALRGVKSTEQE
jgi:hypothetical protein